MNKFVFVTSAILTGITVAACSQGATDLPPGHYESSHKSTTSSGTEIETKKSTDVSVDEYGNKKAVVKSKTTEDPEGWFNKRTVNESERVEKER